jgi:hypothetical protein
VTHPINAEEAIKFPGRCVSVSASLVVPRPKKKLKLKSGGGGGGGDSGGDESSDAEIELNLVPDTSKIKEDVAGINFQGGNMSTEDKALYKFFDCSSSLEAHVVKMGIDEPAFFLPGHAPNYGHMFAGCAPDCGNETLSTIGLGIHPITASVCSSAWADRAVSDNGGIFQINILPGMHQYYAPPSKNIIN